MNKFLHKSAAYSSFRPEYPRDLFNFLASFGSKVVLEVGAGSGQATSGLALEFNKIIALDLSYELIGQVKLEDKVLSIQSQAEQLPIRSESIDLICLAQALHWFANDNFYNEAKRVLKPKGYIAAWCYNQTQIDSQVDNVIEGIYRKLSSDKSALERCYVHDNYATLPFPFKRITVPPFKMEVEWDLSQLIGYINTWPSVLEYHKQTGSNIIAETLNSLLSVWGNPENTKLITWPLYLLLGQSLHCHPERSEGSPSNDCGYAGDPSLRSG